MHTCEALDIISALNLSTNRAIDPRTALRQKVQVVALAAEAMTDVLMTFSDNGVFGISFATVFSSTSRNEDRLGAFPHLFGFEQ